MIREVVVLLPDALLKCPSGRAAACAALGAVLWAVGGRYSRSVLTLIAVAAGTLIGLRLPGWCGWKVDGMGLAVGAAVALGTCAFLFHRSVVGLLLGSALMLWAGAGVWICLAGDASWDWHNVHWEGDLVQFVRDAVATLPPKLSRIFPSACFAGLAVGITLAVAFGKLSKVLAHSLAGVTLVVVMGGLTAARIHPAWLANVPGTNLQQGVFLVGLVVAGALLQWQFTPPHRASQESGSRPS